MKFLKTAVIILLAAFTLIACSKSNSKPSTVSIQGTWQGKYGTGTNNPSAFYSFNIKANAVIEELDVAGQVKGQGTWKLEGKILTATYTYPAPANSKYSVIGAFDAASGRILGNWGYNNSVTDGGLWEMNKKN